MISSACLDLSKPFFWVILFLLVLFWFLTEWRIRRLRLKGVELETKLHNQSTQLEKARQNLMGLNLTDPVTGLPNQRYVTATISDDVLRAHSAYEKSGSLQTTASNQDLGFIKIQIDQLENINERFGYATGDELVLHYKEIIQNASRGSDGLIRSDDEHFLLIVRNTNRTEMSTLASRICQNIAQHPMPIDETQHIQCTCVMGWSVFPLLPPDPTAYSWEEVLELAEACLQMAARKGSHTWIGVIPHASLRAHELGKKPAARMTELVEQTKLILQSNHV